MAGAGGSGASVETDRAANVASSEMPPSQSGVGSGPPPLLSAGIDLETYAAPPTRNDPEARLVSSRRPVPMLGGTPPISNSEAEDDHPAPDRRIRARSEEPIPDLDMIPKLDEPEDAPETQEPLVSPAARDDVRPASVQPDGDKPERAEHLPGSQEVAGSGSPIEPDRPRFRLLSGARDLGRRLIGNHPEERIDSPARPSFRLSRFGERWRSRLPGSRAGSTD